MHYKRRQATPYVWWTINWMLCREIVSTSFHQLDAMKWTYMCAWCVSCASSWVAWHSSGYHEICEMTWKSICDTASGAVSTFDYATIIRKDEVALYEGDKRIQFQLYRYYAEINFVFFLYISVSLVIWNLSISFFVCRCELHHTWTAVFFVHMAKLIENTYIWRLCVLLNSTDQYYCLLGSKRNQWTPNKSQHNVTNFWPPTAKTTIPMMTTKKINKHTRVLNRWMRMQKWQQQQQQRQQVFLRRT